MSQKFNFVDFFPEEIMVDIPRNKYATLQQLRNYEHHKVHMGKCKLGWLCDTLIQTYNTSVLDLSDPTFKDACVEQAYKCVNEENVYGQYKRTVLSQLILNHSIQNDPDVPKKDKKPITDFIGGPLSLTMHWSKEYKKLIYIFGEHHSVKTDCWQFRSDQVMLIEDYLEQLFKNTDVFIDFYLETGRTYQDYGDTRTAVIATRCKDCFHNPNTKENENKCKLSRMHYFDVRRESSNSKPNRMSYASRRMSSILDALDKLIYLADAKTRLQKLLCIVESLQMLISLLDAHNYDLQIKPILEEFSTITIYDDKADDEKYAEYDAFWETQIKEHMFVTKKVTRSTIHDKIKSFIKKEMRDIGKYSKTIDIKILVKTVKDFLVTLDKYSTRTTNKYDFESITENDSKILLNLDFSEFLVLINGVCDS